MRGRRLGIVVGALAIGALYWLAVTQVTGAAEPWDSPDYWQRWYPLALLLSAIAGLIIRREGWLAGAMLVLAQVPVVWAASGTGPLAIVGLLFAGVLALPAMAVASIAGLARRQ